MPGRAETEIALANLDVLARGRVLVAGFPDSGLAAALVERRAPPTAFSPDLRAARAHARTCETVHAPWLVDVEPFDTLVLCLPKETELLRMQLSMARALMTPGARCLVSGRNDAGIKSATRHLRELIGEPEVVDYRHHGRLLSATAAGEPPPFDPDAWRARFDATVDDWRAEMVSYPGVFAHGRLDDATAMLIDALPSMGGARALDIGCGSGALARVLSDGGAEVEAVDVNALAVQATTETVAGTSCTVASADVYPDDDRRFSLIVSNPPFHAGVRTTSAVTERLILGAPDHLEAGGELWLVFNRFLDYMPMLTEAFRSVQVVAEDRRFRVTRAAGAPAR